jgi:hypothetical protein
VAEKEEKLNSSPVFGKIKEELVKIQKKTRIKDVPFITV